MFFRSRADYLFAGVLGGLGKYWDVDSVVLRFIFGFSILLTGGITVLIYLLLAKIIPLEPPMIRPE
ncbi:MAG: PspC domain-containing protein [Candidatus Heimdallarchaeota archaeon]|nr:PspC domain-containing protein [Candidatus Heimdallarchaeota archaeon]